MRATVVETLAVLEPISMMVAMFALGWVLLPYLQRLPAGPLALIATYPAVTRINEAIAEPTILNIVIAAIIGILPFVFAYKAWSNRKKQDRVTDL